MQLLHRIALGGTELDSVDSKILIGSVSTGSPRETEITGQRGGNGTRFVRKRRDSIEVSVSAGIRTDRTEMSDRETVIEKVNKWAANLPGWLTTNQKPGRRMRVESVTLPAAGDPAEWTNKYTWTFKANCVPYWQDTTATTASIATTDSGSGSITIPGNTETVINAEIKNEGESDIDDIAIRIGTDSIFTFSALGLGAGKKLIISHGDDGILSIRKEISDGTTSVLNKRTADSSNDLKAKPGIKILTITTSGTISAVISCFGRYL